MFAVSQPGYKWVVIFEAFLSFSYQGFQMMSFLFYYTALEWSLNASIAMVHVSIAIFSVSAIVSTLVLEGHKQLSANTGVVVATLGNLLLMAAAFLSVMAPLWDQLGVFMTWSAVLGHVLLCAGAGWTRQAGLQLAAVELAAESEEPQHTRSSFLAALAGAGAIGLALASAALPALRMNVVCGEQAVCWPVALTVAAGGLVLGVVPFNVVTREYWWTRPKTSFLRANLFLIGSCAVLRANSVRALRVRRTLRVAALFAPIVVFWMLHDQMFTRWIHQGLVMDGLIDGTTSIEPDAMVFVLAATTMLALPVLRSVLYPLLKVVPGCRTPKIRVVIGAVLASLAFFLAFDVESRVQVCNVRSMPG